MKKALAIAASVIVVFSVFAQVSLHEMQERGTYNAIAQMKVVLCCIDQDGKVLPEVSVSTGVTLDGNPETTHQINGETDKDGCFIIEGRGNGELGYRCKKTGYYDTRETIDLSDFPHVYISGDRWQPYGMTNTVILKRKINPVAMYVATYNSKDHSIAYVGREIGFDLFVNDWVEPEGKGKQADFYVLFHWDGSKYHDYNGSSLTLIFKDRHAGAYIAQTDDFSAFKSPYAANKDELYLNKVEFFYKRGRKASESVNGQLKADQCLILRIRTKVDEFGELIGAHYAKIYAPMDFGYALKTPGSMEMRYYLNPNNNDTNLEADTSKNLLNSRDVGFQP